MLSNLPKELIQTISEYLTEWDLGFLLCTCKHFKEIIVLKYDNKSFNELFKHKSIRTLIHKYSDRYWSFNIGLNGLKCMINIAQRTKLLCKNICMRGACQGGHMNIVEFMIGKGANDWNGGLYCTRWNPDIIKLMIEKGADDFIN